MKKYYMLKVDYENFSATYDYDTEQEAVASAKLIKDPNYLKEYRIKTKKISIFLVQKLDLKI